MRLAADISFGPRCAKMFCLSSQCFAFLRFVLHLVSFPLWMFNFEACTSPLVWSGEAWRLDSVLSKHLPFLDEFFQQRKQSCNIKMCLQIEALSMSLLWSRNWSCVNAWLQRAAGFPDFVVPCASLRQVKGTRKNDQPRKAKFRCTCFVVLCGQKIECAICTLRFPLDIRKPSQ